MKLWEVITTVREMGGTMEDVHAIMRENAGEEEAAPTVAEEETLAEKPVENVENNELEVLRLENAQLKGQLQTYNILHASIPSAAAPAPVDSAVQVGIDMIK